MNPKTKAVVDAFLDINAPASLRLDRRNKLRADRPELFDALEALTNAAIEKKVI